MASALDLPIVFLNVETDRTAAKDAQLADLALHFHARAPARGASGSRNHGDLAGAIVHLIDLKRYEGGAPAARDHAGDAHGLVVVPIGLILPLRNAPAARAAAGNDERAEERHE